MLFYKNINTGKKLLIMLLSCTLSTSTLLPKKPDATPTEEPTALASTLLKRFIRGIKKGTIHFAVSEGDIAEYVESLPDKKIQHVMAINKRKHLEKKIAKIAPMLITKITQMIKDAPEQSSISQKTLDQLNTTIDTLKKKNDERITVPAEFVLILAFYLANLPTPIVQTFLEGDLFG